MDFPAMFGKTCANPPEAYPRPRAGTATIHVLEANDTYIAVYETEDAIQNIRPDFAMLEQLHPFAVAVTAPGRKSDFVSRYKRAATERGRFSASIFSSTF